MNFCLQSTTFFGLQIHLQSTIFLPFWSAIYNKNLGQIYNLHLGQTPLVSLDSLDMCEFLKDALPILFFRIKKGYNFRNGAQGPTFWGKARRGKIARLYQSWIWVPSFTLSDRKHCTPEWKKNQLFCWICSM